MTAAAGSAAPDVRLLPALGCAWAAAWWATAAGAGAHGVARVAWAATTCLAAPAVVGVAVLARGLLATRRHRGGAPLRRMSSTRARSALAALALPLAVSGVVLAATAAQCAARYRAPLVGWIADRAVVEAHGRVTGDPRPVSGGRFGSPGALAVDLTLDRVTGRGRTMDAAAPVLLLAGPDWGRVSAGESVVVIGRLRAADQGDDVVAFLTAQGGPRAVTTGSWPWQVADGLRAGLRRACQGLGSDAGGLLPSLVVGDTSALPGRLRTDLQVAGLTHITAVSGANVAIAAAATLRLAAVLGAGRWARALLTAAVLVGFVVVARPLPSVLRAAAMGAVVLVGLVVARRSRGVPVLAAAGGALLVVDPWLARSAGFALSCLATGGLLLLAPPWTRSLRRRLPAPLAAGLAVPAAAQAACGPVLVLLQPSVSLVSIPANLLAEPAVAPATVLGLVAAGAAPLSAPVAHGAAWLGALATGWIALVAHRSAAAPFAAVPWPAGPGGALVLAVLTALVVAATVRRARPVDGDATDQDARAGGGAGGGSSGERGRATARAPGGSRRPTALAATAILVVATAVGWWLGPRVVVRGPGAWPPSGWMLVQCDVGQGAAMVARSGADRAVVVDTGPDPGLMDACLRRLGVRHLDVLLLTHYHADHVAGLPGALAGRDVGTVLASPLPEPAENVVAVQHALAADHVTARVGWAGASGRAGAAGPGGWSVTWRLLAPVDPPAPTADGSPGAADDGTVVNEASLAYELDVGAPGGGTLRVIGLGDLETAGQQRLLATIVSGATALGGPVDVVEVAHHGSARQVPQLYAALAARVALIGVGAGNDYGHPAPSALGMLGRVGAAAFRTDTSGSIALVPTGEGEVRVATSRAPPQP